jgi:DNA-3-methyladenine glycosylase II
MSNLRIDLKPIAPYRLDFTARALRRVTTNAVDVVAEHGVYLRALRPGTRRAILQARQTAADILEVEIAGSDPDASLAVLETMLGTRIDLKAWYMRASRFPWLAELARDLRGLKPPRYPGVFESLCNGIIFQQLSIVAASTIMRRLVERLSSPVEHSGNTLYPFPSPEALLDATPQMLRAVGLSRQKASALRSAAAAVRDGTIGAATVASMSSDDAAKLLQDLPGIGPWTAANILLRGFGRLDVFPMGDSGALANIKLLSGDVRIDLARVLDELGDMRGMLYFHLLLGRLRRDGAI